MLNLVQIGVQIRVYIWALVQMEGRFGMEGIPESENFTERIGTEAGSRWSDVLYKGKTPSSDHFPWWYHVA